MKVYDAGNKVILRQTIDGQERSVGFMEYRERTDEGRVITGIIESLPHLDPYETGVELLTFLRNKYPRPDWSLETEPKWCRVEYLAMIQRSVADGHNFYDITGTSVPIEEIQADGGLTENWKYESLGQMSPQPPTITLWPVMEQLDEE